MNDRVNLKTPDEAREMRCPMSLGASFDSQRAYMCLADSCMAWRATSDPVRRFVRDRDAAREAERLWYEEDCRPDASVVPPRPQYVPEGYIFHWDAEEGPSWHEPDDVFERRRRDVPGWCGLAGPPAGLPE